MTHCRPRLYIYIYTVWPENLAGIKFGGLASEAENLKLADLNLADRVRVKIMTSLRGTRYY